MLREMYEPIISKEPPVILHTSQVVQPKLPNYVRVVCMGETLGDNTIIPPMGDILIHTGNYTNLEGNGTTSFAEYLNKLDFKYKIIIAGTQEHPLSKSVLSNRFGNVLFLNGSTTKVETLRICAVSTLDSDKGILFKPTNTYNDIVISHFPPAGILDQNEYNESIGSVELLQNLEEYPPRVCIVGGQAPGHGALWHNGTLYINASIHYWSYDDYQYVQYGYPLTVDILKNDKVL